MRNSESIAQILVVCTGNICRSPMAEALFAHYLDLFHLKGTVFSRGLAAPIGRAPHPFALQVAERYGVPISSEKRSTPLVSAEVTRAAVIFVMDSGHRRDLLARHPTATGKTFLLGQWLRQQEIADPINAPVEDFELAWHQCEEGVKTWLPRLKDAQILPAS